jgi:hypothetical protein
MWVDAICINQGDISERNQQVAIMHEIYRSASQVLVWAGSDNGDRIDVAIMMMAEIANRLYRRCAPCASFPCWLLSLPCEDDKEAIITRAYPISPTEFTETQWNAFWSFFQAKWFFRVWVIQEVRQSLNVWLACGDRQIEWSIAALAASWVWSGVPRNYGTHWKKDYFPSYHGFSNTHLMWDKRLSTRREAPFLALLHAARPFEATDARDKVFALLRHDIFQQDTKKSFPSSDYKVRANQPYPA